MQLIQYPVNQAEGSQAEPKDEPTRKGVPESRLQQGRNDTHRHDPEGIGHDGGRDEDHEQQEDLPEAALKEIAENNVASLLSNLQINPNVKELFIEVLKDSDAQVNEDKTTELKKKIERKNMLEEQLNSADDMLLTGKLNTERYNSIVDRYSSELRALNLEIEALKSNEGSLFEFIDASVELLSNLDKLFIESGYDGKKIIAGSIFSDKLIFGNECCRTTKINEVIEVLNRNSKGLKGLKNGKAVKKDSLSVKVPGAGVEPARFPTGV